MRLTVLGSGAACAEPGGNSSGYLVEEHGVGVLLDCGHGVATTLIALRDPRQLDHIFISHMHADHFIDLLPLRFAITKDMHGLEQPAGTLHLPPGGRDCLAQILAAIHFPPDFIENVWRVREYQADDQIRLSDGLDACIATGTHYIPGWAIRLDGGASLTYTGDTAPSPSVAKLARDSDLLLAEATLDEPETGEVRGHLTPQQAIDLATQANVRRLILTHFWHDTDRDAVLQAAQPRFDGEVMIARDGMVIDVVTP